MSLGNAALGRGWLALAGGMFLTLRASGAFDTGSGTANDVRWMKTQTNLKAIDTLRSKYTECLACLMHYACYDGGTFVLVGAGTLELLQVRQTSPASDSKSFPRSRILFSLPMQGPGSCRLQPCLTFRTVHIWNKFVRLPFLDARSYLLPGMSVTMRSEGWVGSLRSDAPFGHLTC